MFSHSSPHHRLIGPGINTMRSSAISRRGFLGGALAAASAGAVARPTWGRVRFSAAPKIEDWLNAHPQVRESIAWHFPGGTSGQVVKKTYSTWSTVEKTALQQMFDLAWKDQYTLLDDPPVNLSPLDESAATVLKTNDAWGYYLSGVAHSLAVEIGNRVPWSVTNYATDSLAIIFDGTWLFMYDAALKGMRVRAINSGYFTPSPAYPIFKFLKNLGVTGAADPPVIPPVSPVTGSRIPAVSPQRQAIGRLFDWCRLNLHHATMTDTNAQMAQVFQYPGFPPLSRIIAGTVNTGAGVKDNPAKSWTAGCIGTVGFLNGVLRTINVPVKLAQSCSHSMPVFTSIGATLSHGDDLYDGFARFSPYQPVPYASTDLLISQAQFNTWFGPGAPNPCSNVGRRPAELGLKHLPNELMLAYCQDKKAMTAKADGKVFKMFEKYYTVAQLDATNLWGRLEQKLAAGFKCSGYS